MVNKTKYRVESKRKASDFPKYFATIKLAITNIVELPTAVKPKICAVAVGRYIER